ncbi:hypothetical protein QSJ19_03100 [Gordonia sp. ABSL11-1]|uniref:hypothetical protein n=1 Tax=Gordonia sp. ABSL11-1 TaxID=3053924 RepID=UPI00257256AC|nr:hypothetical protein [Gordonia sp. ABSL11-1]MDL9944587.1 hypothetical protein [Gordonia sp. ABSL11-1]
MPDEIIDVSLWTLSTFLSAATPADRTRAVKNAVEIYENAYDPRNDFYKRIRTALENSVAAGSDDPLELAIRNATEAKRSHYTQIATGWKHWSPRSEASVSGLRGSWTSGSVSIRVSQLLTTSIKRREVLASTYLRAPDLDDNAAQAMTRIMELAFDRPPGSTAVLDIRRPRLIRGRQRHFRNYDDWLESEVAAFEDLFLRMRRAA